MKVRTMDNTCIICGNVIPEGKQHCPMCGTTESDIFGKLMGRKQNVTQPEEFTIKDELEQAYRQGFNEGMKHACEVKQENARLKAIIEHKAHDDNTDGWYE